MNNEYFKGIEESIAENTLPCKEGETIFVKYGEIVRKLGMWIESVIKRFVPGGIER